MSKGGKCHKEKRRKCSRRVGSAGARVWRQDSAVLTREARSFIQKARFEHRFKTVSGPCWQLGGENYK